MTAFRFTTAGESHGPGLTAIVEGMPAGLELDREALDRDMARRQLGHGRGGRMRIETDTVEVRSGVRHGRTLGSPIALLVANRDYKNWEDRMNPWPVEDFEPEEVHLPRPGHADLVGAQKYGFTRHPQRAGARQRPRDRRPRRRRLGRPRLPHRARRRGPQPRDLDRLGGRGGARGAHPGRLRGHRRRPGPHPRPGGQQGDGRRDQPPAEGEREPRRHLRGDRLRARPRARLAHLLGRPPRRAARPGGRLDPVDQGRLDRRSVGRGDAAPARKPTTRSSGRRRTATSAKRTAPAASRAG